LFGKFQKYVRIFFTIRFDPDSHITIARAVPIKLTLDRCKPMEFENTQVTKAFAPMPQISSSVWVDLFRPTPAPIFIKTASISDIFSVIF
jgi:hypothetical protein